MSSGGGALSAEAVEYLVLNLSDDDAKLYLEVLPANGIKSVADIKALSKAELSDMKVPIGPRNRLLAITGKLVAPRMQTPPPKGVHPDAKVRTSAVPPPRFPVIVWVLTPIGWLMSDGGVRCCTVRIGSVRPAQW
jgi:hypothetical protein